MLKRFRKSFCRIISRRFLGVCTFNNICQSNRTRLDIWFHVLREFRNVFHILYASFVHRPKAEEISDVTNYLLFMLEIYSTFIFCQHVKLVSDT